MNRDEHLKFCKVCTKRKFNSKKGLVCSLTNEIADFEENCTNFEKDNSVIIIDHLEKRNLLTDSYRNLFFFSIILLISGIASYLIQESGFLYRGDSLGNIAIFIFSFFLLSTLMYKFLMPVKISFVHTKSVFGILSLITSFTMFLFSIAIIMYGKLISWAIVLLIVAVYNFIYLSSTKFWIKDFLNKNYIVLAIINIILVTIPSVWIISLMLKQLSRLDNEDQLTLIVILIGVLVNYLYSINLLRKK